MTDVQTILTELDEGLTAHGGGYHRTGDLRLMMTRRGRDTLVQAVLDAHGTHRPLLQDESYRGIRIEQYPGLEGGADWCLVVRRPAQFKLSHAVTGELQERHLPAGAILARGTVRQ